MGLARQQGPVRARPRRSVAPQPFAEEAMPMPTTQKAARINELDGSTRPPSMNDWRRRSSAEDGREDCRGRSRPTTLAARTAGTKSTRTARSPTMWRSSRRSNAAPRHGQRTAHDIRTRSVRRMPPRAFGLLPGRGLQSIRIGNSELDVGRLLASRGAAPGCLRGFSLGVITGICGDPPALAKPSRQSEPSQRSRSCKSRKPHRRPSSGMHARAAARCPAPFRPDSHRRRLRFASASPCGSTATRDLR